MATLAYTGDVTALLAVALGAHCDSPERQWLLLAGLGSQLHAYLLPAGRRLCCQAVLPGGTRVHGVHAVALPSLPGTVLLAVHGGRHAAVWRLDWAGGRLALLCTLPRLGDWTMDVHLSLAGGGASALLAVGLSDNSLQVHSVGLLGGRRRLLLAARGAEQSLLYSMALLLQQQPAAGTVRYWVAAGTIFHDVIVWASAAVAESDSGDAEAGGCEAVAAGGSPETAPSLFRLRGHEGSIHRWAAG
jgi:hypothetical protein